MNALITGGTKGIGYAIAERLLKEGYNVYVTYHLDDKAALNIKELQLIYPNQKIETLKIDCGNLSNIKTIKQYLIDNNIKLSTLILNAGTTSRSKFGEISIDDWQNVFNVNLNFPIFLLQEIYSELEDNSSIILTGSLMAIHPHSASLTYGISKAAVHSMVKNLVKFLAPRKIRINAVAPGYTDTDWQKTKPKELREQINKRIALNHFINPDQLSDAYLFLINNKYVNGEILTIDGGYSFE